MSEPFTYDQAATAMREIGQIILSVEKAHLKAIEDAASAEALYRKSLGDKFAEYRQAGKGVEESTTLARRDVFNLSNERDKAVGRVRYELERLENRRGQRASLHKLVDWSGTLAAVNASKSNGGVSHE